MSRSPLSFLSKTRLKYYFNTAHYYQDLHCSLMYRCPTAVLITRDTAKSAFHYNLYTPISCYHLPGSSLPALQHSTSLHATSCHLPRLSIRGSRPICLPAVSSNLPPPVLVHLLPFIVVTVPGVHHLLSLIQCSFHVFKTTFPIPLTFFHPLPVLSISNAVHSHLPFFPIHAAFNTDFLVFVSL